MARSNSKKGRVNYSNAKRSLPLSDFSIPSPKPIRFTIKPLQAYEDRRQWNPEGRYAPARSFSKTRHRLMEVPARKKEVRHENTGLRPFSSNFLDPAYRIGFVEPDRVLICARRKIRREVMHATGNAGKRGQKLPRRNFYSKIKC